MYNNPCDCPSTQVTSQCAGASLHHYHWQATNYNCYVWLDHGALWHFI